MTGRQAAHIHLATDLLAVKTSKVREVTINQLSSECSEKSVQVFDEIPRVRQTLNDYRSLLQDHQD